MTATAPLAELPGDAPAPGRPRRRWFSSPLLDLIVWQHEDGGIVAFQLCYDKPLREHSLTWQCESGFSHQAVDPGNPEGIGYKATPLLTATSPADPSRLRRELARAGTALPPDVLGFVDERLQHYASAAPATPAPTHDD